MRNPLTCYFLPVNFRLTHTGLSSLFEEPNLCGLNSESMLVLDDIRHKAFLKLTEKGVEAGAVTSMSFSRSFPSFSALRPFILLLWNDEARVPLFIGRVTDPWARQRQRVREREGNATKHMSRGERKIEWRDDVWQKWNTSQHVTMLFSADIS